MRPSLSPRSAADRVALVLATGFGFGYGPIAPGTWGSLPGLALAWLSFRTGGAWAVLAVAAIVSAVGVWAAGRVEGLAGEKDPGLVVIDEIAGQMVTLTFIDPTSRVLAAGFVLFRIFDVWKPWPARRLEDLPGGSGIMADDLMAGLYASLALHAAAWALPSWMGSA